MTTDDFEVMMSCNEPDFQYNGQTYSICHPDANYYVTASDQQKDLELIFQSLDDLLDNWIIQGIIFRTLLSKISF